MKKTSIYLDAERDHALARRAAERGMTKAALMRESLFDAVRGGRRPRITAIGVDRGPGDVADDVDRHLAETGFGDE